MREILFRGKSIHSGKWIEGYVFPQYIDCDYAPLCITKEPICANDYSEILGDWVEVDPETVGQFTGLTDKNGKKIFEGDILLIRSAHHLVGDKNEDIGQVALHGVGDCWWAKSKYELSHYPYGYYLSVMCDKETYNTDYEVEIIGNIYDNPELMEV